VAVVVLGSSFSGARFLLDSEESPPDEWPIAYVSTEVFAIFGDELLARSVLS
jgi:hypothetical protein